MMHQTESLRRADGARVLEPVSGRRSVDARGVADDAKNPARSRRSSTPRLGVARAMKPTSVVALPKIIDPARRFPSARCLKVGMPTRSRGGLRKIASPERRRLMIAVFHKAFVSRRKGTTPRPRRPS
jgi:hypothetical protein